VSAAESIRVAIVEDQQEIREGLAYLINTSPGFRCVAALGSAELALETIPPLDPRVVLMDIELPGMSGIECIGRLKALLPATQIMMLTVFDDPARIFESLAAGASGYLTKKTPPARLLESIQDLASGGSPMSMPVARLVVDAFRKTISPPRANPTTPANNLSPRENEILALLAQGFLYKEIADQLQLSIHTVRTHIRNIYEKLHVRTRMEAVVKARL
jgi:DNA-binding NarL/FixJ family response regulator